MSWPGSDSANRAGLESDGAGLEVTGLEARSNEAGLQSDGRIGLSLSGSRYLINVRYERRVMS